MGKFKSCVWGVGVTRIASDLKEMFAVYFQSLKFLRVKKVVQSFDHERTRLKITPDRDIPMALLF